MFEWEKKDFLSGVTGLVLMLMVSACVPEHVNQTPLIQTNTISGECDLRVIGCATNRNLAAMIADPRDLEEGQVPGSADGEVAAKSIDRLRAGEGYELIDQTISGLGN